MERSQRLGWLGGAGSSGHRDQRIDVEMGDEEVGIGASEDNDERRVVSADIAFELG